jgi:hypothetical protein
VSVGWTGETKMIESFELLGWILLGTVMLTALAGATFWAVDTYTSEMHTRPLNANPPTTGHPSHRSDGTTPQPEP